MPRLSTMNGKSVAMALPGILTLMEDLGNGFGQKVAVREMARTATHTNGGRGRIRAVAGNTIHMVLPLL